MTDRIRHLTVTLDRDTRDDDAECLIAAIRQLKGVAVVEPRVVDVPDILARSAVRADVETRLHEAVDSVFRQQTVREQVNAMDKRR